MELTRYEIAVNFIRAHGPMTVEQLAERLGWKLSMAKYAVSRAQFLSLLKKNRRLHPMPRGAQPYVYGAVQVPGWPLPAPDTFEGVQP